MTTAPTTLPDLTRVEYDPDRSTRGCQVYTVASKRIEGLRYTTCHDVEGHGDAAWRCQCPAYTYRGTCSHIDVAALFARVRWWERTLGRYSPSMLREVRATRQYAIDMGDDSIEDRAAVIACGRLLGEVTP
jgi:hypothetical protein